MLRKVLYIICGASVGAVVLTLLHGTGLLLGGLIGGAFGFIFSFSAFSGQTENEQNVETGKIGNKIELPALGIITLIAICSIFVINKGRVEDPHIDQLFGNSERYAMLKKYINEHVVGTALPEGAPVFYFRIDDSYGEAIVYVTKMCNDEETGRREIGRLALNDVPEEKLLDGMIALAWEEGRDSCDITVTSCLLEQQSPGGRKQEIVSTASSVVFGEAVHFLDDIPEEERDGYTISEYSEWENNGTRADLIKGKDLPLYKYTCTKADGNSDEYEFIISAVFE